MKRTVRSIEEERSQALREFLLDYDHRDIINALGEGDLLEAISAQRIMDYIWRVVMERTDMREIGSQRWIFKREVLSLAERIRPEE